MSCVPLAVPSPPVGHVPATRPLCPLASTSARVSSSSDSEDASQWQCNKRAVHRAAEEAHAQLLQAIGSRVAPTVFQLNMLYDFCSLDDMKSLRLLTAGMLAIHAIQEVRVLIVCKRLTPPRNWGIRMNTLLWEVHPYT